MRKVVLLLACLTLPSCVVYDPYPYSTYPSVYRIDYYRPRYCVPQHYAPYRYTWRYEH